jgi:hypothetical protein
MWDEMLNAAASGSSSRQQFLLDPMLIRVYPRDPRYGFAFGFGFVQPQKNAPRIFPGAMTRFFVWLEASG